MTDTARDVIARALGETGLDCVDDVDATFVIAAIHAAGCRILGPSEVQALRALADWLTDEVGADIDLTPGLQELISLLKAKEAQDGY